MRSRLAFLSLVLCAAGALAQDTPIARTGAAIRQADAAWRRAQGDAGTASARDRAEASLREALGPLEAQNAKRAAEFAVAAARPLPEKAMTRLQASRAAHAATFERLAAILRQLLADPKPETLEAARPALLAEALQIVDGIEASARQKPISQTLPVNSPQQQPPPIGVPSGSITTVPIGTIPATLQQAADALPGVAEVYEAVRNLTKAEFYYGVMKGAAETYREGSGNDADTASVLAQMIRAKGVPARYVRGRVELSAKALMGITGAATIGQAVRVFERAGIPHEVVLGGGSVAALQFERVWVEAYVPYANYRGSMLDAQGKAWIPLDAGFKSLEPPRGTDLTTIGFDASAIFADYLSGNQTETPMQYIKREVSGLAAAAGQAYSSLLNSRGHGGQVSGLLPNSLPYRVVTVTERSYDLPESLHHTIRITGTLNGETILDYTTQTEEVVGRRVTLSYSPGTQEEAALVTAYGGLLRTPPYLIEVKPVISINGVPAYAGTPAPMGVVYTLRMEIRTPGGTQTIENRVQTGNLIGVGLGGAVQAQQVEDETSAAQILSNLALRYFDSWNASDKELADLLHVIPVRPTVSVCLVSSSIEVEYADGDGLLPVGWEWKGLFIDADLRATSPVGVRDREAEKRFIQLSGLEGSVLENKVFEDAYQIASVSTAKVLGMAASQGIPILEITSGNLDAVETLPFDAEVKAEVLDAAQRGRRVTIPSTPVTYLAWTGVGYLIQDDENQAAAYQLQGGHSGGVTAPSRIEIRSDLPDAFENPTGEPVVGDPDKIVGSIKVVPSTNFQIGTVDKASEPLSVFVTDGNGFPLTGAVVTFQVIGGGGTLENLLGLPGGGTVSVISDDRGYATTRLRYGTRTDLIPRYLGPAVGEEHSTQVGLNLITASAGLARLAEPFTLFGKPDERRPGPGQPGEVDVVLKAAQGGGWLSNLRVAGRLDIAVQDQFGNPISNVPIRVTSRVAEPGATPGVRAPIADYGGVLNQTDYARCAALTPTVFKGECAGERDTLPIKSSNLGVFAFVAMGASTGSYYVFDYGPEPAPPYVGWAAYGTVGTFCTEGDCNLLKTPISYTSSGNRGIWRNANGDEVEAYAPGAVATMTFFSDVVREKDRVIRNTQNGKYYVEGINEWVRERLEGSTVTLTPQTPGTLAQNTATPVDGAPGEYEASVTMAMTPQRNTVDYEVRAVGPRPRAALDGEVELQYVDTSDPLNKKLKPKPEGWWNDPARASITRNSFSLWGVRAGLYPQGQVPPEPIFLTPGNKTAHASSMNYLIEPPEWAQLLEPTQIQFSVEDLSGGRLLSAAGTAGETSGRFSIPRDLPLSPGIHPANLTIQRVLGSTGQDLFGLGRLIQAGVIDLSVDTNNDTFVDEEDDEAARRDASQPFVFWEGDTRLEPQDAITDYSTVKIRVPFPQSRYDFEVSLANSSFELKKKHPNSGVCEGDEAGQIGKGYLCNEGTYEAQQASFTDDPQPQPRGANAFVIAGGSTSAGPNEFLMRCNAREDGDPACPARALYLSVVDRESSQAISPAQPVATRSVSIKPFQELTAMATLRQDTTPSSDPSAPIFRVNSTFTNEPGWLPVVEGVVGETERVTLFVHGYNVTHEQFTRTYTYPDPNPPPGVPVNPVCSQTGTCRRNAPSWFSQWAKRSYWSGNPTLSAQKALVVGVSWPGDIPGFISPGLYLPEDEFNALQAGLPLGRLVRSLRSNLGEGKRVAIFAHSLGNMLVNNALKEVPGTGAAVNYVMNDAAIATEAFEGGFDVNDPAFSSLLVAPLLAHARTLGFADPPRALDGFWLDQELQLGSRSDACAFEPTSPGCSFAFQNMDFYLSRRLAVAPSLNPLVGATDDPPQTPFFSRRWSKWRRPADPAAFRATPWGRFFSQNLANPNIRIFNTYNANDSLFITDRGTGVGEGGAIFENAHGWLIAQQKAKPYDTLFTTGSTTAISSIPWVNVDASDPVEKQKWWTLEIQGRSNLWASTAAAEGAQQEVWAGEAPEGHFVGDAPTTRGRTRQWAELSIWFPAVSKPVGANVSLALKARQIGGSAFGRLQFLPDEVNGRNVSLTRIGGTAGIGAVGTASHSYLYMSRLANVWRGYKVFAALWAQ